MGLPFKETKLGVKFIRTFDQNIDEGELVWHRDREDRIVKPLSESDWMIQIDNELPKPLKEEVFIPKGVYHRVIKGSGDLVVELTKLGNVIKEENMGDFDWVDDIPDDYDSGVYNFLKENFKVKIHKTNIFLDIEPMEFKLLYGMDETFNINFSSKKRVLNKIYWLIEDEFPNVEKSILRRTIRVFLNEVFN